GAGVVGARGGGDGGGEEPARGGGTTGAAPGAPPPPTPAASPSRSPASSPSPSSSSSPSSPSSSSSSSSAGAPGSAVGVAVTADRDRYSGPCPAPAHRAPAFHALLTVDRVPARVVYRWITGSGRVTDGGWRTAVLGGSPTVSVPHTETAHRAGDPERDWIAVEVASPREVTSARVPFTVVCRPEPSSASPSGGASRDAGR
ncbi:hypothetical protein I5Q34_20430, partial [Streptomyces sp. AV19]|nr:hypothetical protein [Streptomyces sp. AV19]